MIKKKKKKEAVTKKQGNALEKKNWGPGSKRKIIKEHQQHHLRKGGAYEKTKEGVQAAG